MDWLRRLCAGCRLSTGVQGVSVAFSWSLPTRRPITLKPDCALCWRKGGQSPGGGAELPGVWVGHLTCGTASERPWAVCTFQTRLWNWVCLQRVGEASRDDIRLRAAWRGLSCVQVASAAGAQCVGVGSPRLQWPDQGSLLVVFKGKDMDPVFRWLAATFTSDFRQRDEMILWYFMGMGLIGGGWLPRETHGWWAVVLASAEKWQGRELEWWERNRRWISRERRI